MHRRLCTLGIPLRILGLQVFDALLKLRLEVDDRTLDKARCFQVSRRA